MRRLQDRTPMDWYCEIAYFWNPGVRCQIAVMVWIEFIADRFHGFKSRTILDAWRREWTFDIHVRQEVVEKALIRLGWPPAVAKARAWILGGIGVSVKYQEARTRSSKWAGKGA